MTKWKNETMNPRKLRDLVHLCSAMLFVWMYIPHILLYALNVKRCRTMLNTDMPRMKARINVSMCHFVALIYLLHHDACFRSWFYYRVGAVCAMLVGWYRPGKKDFIISYSTKIGKNFAFAHPYATVLNAEVIGDNCSCQQCSTIGSTVKGRPYIGNNVDLGANVVLIGPVHIGDNVQIGAGSVVVKDIPSNSVAVGNPAHVVKSLPPITTQLQQNK